MSERLDEFRQRLENDQSEIRIELAAAKGRVEELEFALSEVEETLEEINAIKRTS